MILSDDEISECIKVADRDSGVYRKVSWHIHLSSAIEKAILKKIGEPVAIAEVKTVHGNTCQFLNRTTHGMSIIEDGMYLFAMPKEQL